MNNLATHFKCLTICGLIFLKIDARGKQMELTKPPLTKKQDIILVVYILINIMFGMLLSQVMKIDVSGFMEKYFGVLRFQEKVMGNDIQTKAMILLIAIIFSPLTWFYFNTLTTKEKINEIYGSNVKVFFLLLVFCPIMSIGEFYGVFSNELTQYNIQHNLLAITKLYIKVTSLDILFGIFASMMMCLSIFMLYAMKMGIEILKYRFNYQTNIK